MEGNQKNALGACAETKKGFCISRWKNKVSATRCFAVRGNKQNHNRECINDRYRGLPNDTLDSTVAVRIPYIGNPYRDSLYRESL
jgi:hypothetical protein